MMEEFDRKKDDEKYDEIVFYKKIYEWMGVEQQLVYIG